ncbi:RNA exonuclease 4 [Erpetoichthys calabaricus]|uniref:RNA exonuclease 4 n=1 Tax=Erpetoichthys calabaricus TaxID=27687 RepID=A0A8C4SPU3_ERPCA|nr:RNA exonuclease 4 [Erpetoichthys calabaricus]XP_051787492.1 RNA exonuclease 4 [Erpetoichthys calabaricus]
MKMGKTQLKNPLKKSGKLVPKQKKKHKLKKKKFWRSPNTCVTTNAEQPSASSYLPPPKDPAQFSANWKSLEQVLNKKKDLAPVQGNQPTFKKKFKKEPQILHEEKETSAKCQTQTDCKHLPEKTYLQTLTTGNYKSGHTHVKNGQKTEKDHRETGRNAQSGDCKPREDDIWFDDVNPDDIEIAIGPEAAEIARKKYGVQKVVSQEVEKVLVKDRAFEGLTKIVAMDCEMVGVGPSGEDSIVARVSIVNHFGKCIYDKYVKSTEKVTDFRTAVSGVRPEHLRKGEDFKIVQKEVSDILKGRILVGHAISNDLKILFLDHPKKNIRDTQKYKPFKQQVKSGRPSLKLLCQKILNVKVQESEHSSVQDAQAAMRLYTMVRKQWEAAIRERFKVKKLEKRKVKDDQLIEA